MKNNYLSIRRIIFSDFSTQKWVMRIIHQNYKTKFCPVTVLNIFGWLVLWVLWHINLCRLFNAESIFMKIVLFETIQFRKSTQLKCKYSLIV